MKHYIVRIYRHEKDNPRMLVGLVEEVGSKGQKGFTGYDDLWEILNRDGAVMEKKELKDKRAGR